ncbi:hypothetical protein [Marinomonas profundi]|nr:hypothetical protein [Marinomonas profundi]
MEMNVVALCQHPSSIK